MSPDARNAVTEEIKKMSFSDANAQRQRATTALAADMLERHVLLEDMMFGPPNATLPPKVDRWTDVQFSTHAQQLPFTGPAFDVMKTALTNLTISFAGEAQSISNAGYFCPGLIGWYLMWVALRKNMVRFSFLPCGCLYIF